MGNCMGRHSYEPVVESDIPPLGHTLVFESPESDMQPSIENTTNKILEELSKVRGKASKTSGLNFGCKERKDVAVGLSQIKSLDEKNMSYLEKDVGVHQGKIKPHPTAIDVCFLNEIVLVTDEILLKPNQKSLDDDNERNIIKKLNPEIHNQSYPEDRVGYQKKLLPQNYQAIDAYRKIIQDKQQQSIILTKKAIRRLIKQSRVRKIIDEDDPLKTSCNNERNFQGSSGTHSNYDLEREEKMPCGVAYRMK